MGASNPLHDETPADVVPAAADDGNGSSRTMGTGSRESEPADAMGDRKSRDHPTMPPVTSAEASIDPIDPATSILQDNASAIATAMRPDGIPPPVSRERPLPVVDGYEILAELGRG